MSKKLQVEAENLWELRLESFKSEPGKPHYYDRGSYCAGYIAAAKPRDKRSAELEKELEDIEEAHDYDLREQSDRNSMDVDSWND